MERNKPILSLEGQIEHLKSKGVKFDIFNETEAKDYLTSHNNYFKLTAYRKNYAKHPDGENKDKYIELDFAYLPTRSPLTNVCERMVNQVLISVSRSTWQ